MESPCGYQHQSLRDAISWGCVPLSGRSELLVPNLNLNCHEVATSTAALRLIHSSARRSIDQLRVLEAKCLAFLEADVADLYLLAFFQLGDGFVEACSVLDTGPVDGLDYIVYQKLGAFQR